MPSKVNLIGKKFNRLTVIKEELQRSKKGRVRWLCQCKCGKQTIVDATSLIRGNTRSCGCYNKQRVTETHKTNIEGKRFTRLIPIKTVGKTSTGKYIWECQCDCGKITNVAVDCLTSGNTKSCGCYSIDRTKEVKTKHGKSLTSGRHKLYKTWCGIKTRCNNPNANNYHNYGGRGIKICQEWSDSFEAFYNYVGEPPSDTHTLDRIDNNGNYEPGNVRWATRLEQYQNSRRIRLFTYNGKTQSMKEWAEELGINYRTLSSRINKQKLDFETAILKEK